MAACSSRAASRRRSRTKLQDGDIHARVLREGPFQKLLETIPVNVVMNEQVGLYGALLEAGHAAAAGD